MGRLWLRASVLAAAGCAAATEATPIAAARNGLLVVAAGDIACAGEATPYTCRQRDTSELALAAQPDLVLALGDLQYLEGRYADFLAFYDPTWGRLKARTRPAPGNHEYLTPRAQGYFDYFNGPGAASGPAGDRERGYYSFDAGDWHFVAINSNCEAVGGCGAGSPQEAWLRADLAAHRRPCTLAYWHHPRFSSSVHGNAAFMSAIWQALYEAGVDVVLNGHGHHYERFARQTPQGAPDPARGIRQIVVGTGGSDLTQFRTVQPHSEARNAGTYGVLELVLRPGSYEWRYAAVGGGFKDSGSGTCH